MTSLNLATVLAGLDGNPMKESDATDAKDATLRSVLLKAALVTLPGDDQMSADQKVGLALLTQRIYGDNAAEFTSEETTILKERVGKAFSPIVVLRIFELLDPASVPGFSVAKTGAK